MAKKTNDTDKIWNKKMDNLAPHREESTGEFMTTDQGLKLMMIITH